MKENKVPSGINSKFVANGPDITINANHNYVKKFTAVHADKGNWKLVADNSIQHEMVIPNNSSQGNLIKQTQGLTGIKWRTDAKVNYLDTSTGTIILLTASEMRSKHEKNYVQV